MSVTLPLFVVIFYKLIRDEVLKKKKIFKNLILSTYFSFSIILIFSIFWRLYLYYFEIGNIPTGIVP